ncbi:hypothetical protein [Mariniflexile sp.]|uniref:hypothetical protein n=1 Tax=Mariniflexile sp. TaxID=1979402 RepID=UPI0035636D7E
MILKKIKQLVDENRKYHKEQLLLLKELDWANVYHDSIRGKEYLEKLPLNIGRWAGNYSFFYVLNRVLQDYKPKTILEFGLGESTKFISTYLTHTLLQSHHLVVEHNVEWKEKFLETAILCDRSEIFIAALEEKEVEGYNSRYYSGLSTKITGSYDLYVIDGPIGSLHYSRYNIVDIAEKFSAKNEFIIIFDDINRKGEQDTIKNLLAVLAKKSIKVFTQIYDGRKSVVVIATALYKPITSI